MDKLEDEDFESEGISREGLDSVYLWAKGRAGHSAIGCKGAGTSHQVSPYALSSTHLPLIPTMCPWPAQR